MVLNLSTRKDIVAHSLCSCPEHCRMFDRTMDTHTQWKHCPGCTHAMPVTQGGCARGPWSQVI